MSKRLWDQRFIEMASLVASWSKDPGAKVGAVIVDDKKRIVSVGFNGFPSGVNDDEEVLANREIKLMRTIHAEENAILFAQRDLTGCSLYVNYPPCANCAAKIIQVGITDVYFLKPDSNFSANWAMQINEGRNLFLEAGVDSTNINFNNELRG